MKPAQEFGLFLQVAIDQEDQISPRVPQARHDRAMVAEIARKINHPDPLVPLEERHRKLERGVRRAVVHEDEFEIRSNRRCRRTDPTVKLLHVRLRAVQRGDDGEIHRPENQVSPS